MGKEIPLVPDTGRVSRGAGRLLITLFLLILLLPPVAQLGFELWGRDRKIQELDLFRKSGRPLLQHLQAYEKALEKNSVLSSAVQPWVQWTQLSLARQGNEKVLVGNGNWLFYRPCVEFVTGPAFSGTSRPLRPNEDGPKNPDPFPAIVHFHQQLKAQGIDLVVVPVPVKATICPERLSGRFDARRGPPVNLSLQAFYRRLEDEGVPVVDLTPHLWEQDDREGLFLPHDSHWSPRGMGVFASGLAESLKKRFPALTVPTTAYRTREVQVSNHGDLFDMLRLPSSVQPFPRTTVTLQQVIDAGTGKPVESDDASPIVLLGDSATNIFSAEAMKWGAHAGLAEQLCLRLGRPLHWIAVNGGAATEARRRLAAEGVARKGLVIWQFIARDLSHADPAVGWESVPLPAEATVQETLPDRLVVSAKIVKKSEPPIADAAEIYPDTVTRTLYEITEVVDGAYRGSELLAVEWAQVKKRPTRTSDFQIGDVHRLVLEPLREARKKNKAIAIAGSVDDVRRLDLPAFWVVEHRP